MTTLEQLEKWAPNPGAWERAQALAKANKWRSLGAGKDLCWGLARTAGATRHQVLLRLEDQHFFCSCTVRKKPCKHVLALALLALESPGEFRSFRILPDWVEEAIVRLAPKPEGPQEPPAPSSEALEQRRRNREKRIDQMVQGMEELERWLGDAIRQGLGSLEGQINDQLERFAARMVDAKLSGIGRRVRSWKYLAGTTGWQDALLAEMADLFLLVRAFRQSDQLPEPLVQDLLQAAGASLRKDEVLQGQPVPGVWTVMGLVEGEEDNLRFRRAWVQDAHSGRFALLLDFAWGDQPFEHQWTLGQEFDGNLFYYPSAYPQRALAGEINLKKIQDPLPLGIDAFDELLREYAEALARQPWLSRYPAFLQNVRPFRQNNRWGLVDSRSYFLPLSCSDETGWNLLSLSGGEGLDLFGEWNGATFSPLSSLSSGRWIALF
jgi:hypothetical protein